MAIFGIYVSFLGCTRIEKLLARPSLPLFSLSDPWLPSPSVPSPSPPYSSKIAVPRSNLPGTTIAIQFQFSGDKTGDLNKQKHPLEDFKLGGGSSLKVEYLSSLYLGGTPHQTYSLNSKTGTTFEYEKTRVSKKTDCWGRAAHRIR